MDSVWATSIRRALFPTEDGHFWSAAGELGGSRRSPDYPVAQSSTFLLFRPEGDNMKLRMIALTVALALLGGGFLATSAASGKPKPVTDEVQLGITAADCTVSGQATKCDVDVTRLKRAGSQIIASGTVTPQNGEAVKFRAPLATTTNTVVAGAGAIGESALVQQIPTPPSCDILNLVLGPLHLDLLGLVIDLNQVVLNITGQTGAGNLLGNLLCGLFGILDGLPLLQQLAQALQNLLAVINDILAL